MKTLAIIFVSLIMSLTITGKSFTTVEEVACDYWSEVVYNGYSYWLFEYCGDKLIAVSQIEFED